MPLQTGYSDEVIQANIRQLIKDGYPPKQAAAIAFHKSRESYRLEQYVKAEEESTSTSPIDR